MLSFLYHQCAGNNLKDEKYSSMYLHVYGGVYAFLHMRRKKSNKKRFSNFVQSDIMEGRWKRESEMPASEYE